MIKTFRGENVNQLFPEVLEELSLAPDFPSRNGPVKRLVMPTIITYTKPHERILYSQIRDANPFFHFFETLWMLAGRDDLAFLTQFNPRMAEYSDDGKLVRGSAYGVRWRRWFGFDQLNSLVDRLRKDPYDRRNVLTMWDAFSDVEIDSKDVPCNTHCYFNYRPSEDDTPGCLDLTVANRSNDLIYGCMGSNVFHFSFLLEYMAGRLGMKMGCYHQFTNNLHIYTENPTAKRCLDLLDDVFNEADPWENALVAYYPKGHYPLFEEGANPDGWDHELEFFLRTGSEEDFIYAHSFFPKVALPLLRAHTEYKSKRYPANLEGSRARISLARAWVEVCEDGPLRRACMEWLDRRQRALERKYG